MCMRTIEKRVPKLPVTRAWKVFTVGHAGRLFSPMVSGPFLRVGIWHKARRRRLHGYAAAVSYLSGFHTFMTAEAAARYRWSKPPHQIVRKVEIRGAAYYGVQCDSATASDYGWTAAEMRILPLRRKVGKE
jgi:hypothetical protein